MLTAPQFSSDGLEVGAGADRGGGTPGGAGPGGRSRLLAVSKQQPAAAIRVLAEAGQREFGENYVQEGVGKIDSLRTCRCTGISSASCRATRRAQVAERFQWVHTVDRERIAPA